MGIGGSSVSQVRQLYDLQGFDLELDAKELRLREIEGQLGESEALARALEDLERDQKRLGELERSRHSLEWEAGDLAGRIRELEQKLYGGSIRNPKELSSLQVEVEHLKALHRQQEDRVLDIMIEIESAQGSIQAKAREAKTLEEEHHRAQEELRRETALLEAAAADLRDKRATAASRIDGAALELYEAVRYARQGRAVVRIEGGRCQGCRIALPITELQRARSPYELVQCGSCGRILFIG